MIGERIVLFFLTLAFLGSIAGLLMGSFVEGKNVFIEESFNTNVIVFDNRIGEIDSKCMHIKEDFLSPNQESNKLKEKLNQVNSIKDAGDSLITIKFYNLRKEVENDEPIEITFISTDGKGIIKEIIEEDESVIKVESGGVGKNSIVFSSDDLVRGNDGVDVLVSGDNLVIKIENPNFEEKINGEQFVIVYSKEGTCTYEEGDYFAGKIKIEGKDLENFN